MSNQCFAPRISPLLRRIESSPLQSAPSRFRTSLLLSKQGRSFPLPLVSRRFRLCSALPYQILESRLQALPWLLVAFYGWAIPFLFRSLRLRWPRFQICSFRLLSQLRHSSAMPIWANRFSAAPSHIVSPRLDAISGQIRSRPSISKPCPYDSNKAGLIASAAFRVRSMRIRSRQSPGSSAPPAPSSTVPVPFCTSPFPASPFPFLTGRFYTSPCFAISFLSSACPRHALAFHNLSCPFASLSVQRRSNAIVGWSMPCRIGYGAERRQGSGLS